MAIAYALVAILIVGTMTSASASTSTSCVNITINNILNIAKCAGNATNFCSNTTATRTAQGITNITNCLIEGISQYGSPQAIVSALAPLLSTIGNRGIPIGINLGQLGNYQLCSSSGCLDFLIKNDSCVGSVNITLPATGNFGSCAGGAAMTCTAGSPTTTNTVQSNVQSIVCILGQLPADQFRTVLQGIACQFTTAINKAVQGDFALAAAFSLFSSTIKYSLGGITCPTVTV